MWDKFKAFVSSAMFFGLVGIVIGSIVVGYGMYYYQSYRVGEAVVLKCFLYKDKVYQITERP